MLRSCLCVGRVSDVDRNGKTDPPPLGPLGGGDAGCSFVMLLGASGAAGGGDLELLRDMRNVHMHRGAQAATAVTHHDHYLAHQRRCSSGRRGRGSDGSEVSRPRCGNQLMHFVSAVAIHVRNSKVILRAVDSGGSAAGGNEVAQILQQCLPSGLWKDALTCGDFALPLQMMKQIRERNGGRVI